MKRLLVLRHAKSDWDVNVDDHARPLNARGKRSATALGEYLARIGEVPDAAYSSTATRARTTLELAVAAGGWDTEVSFHRSLYLSAPSAALRVAAGAPDVDRVMVVGHNPTWTTLVAHLTGGHVAVKTATCVGIDLDISRWAEAGRASGVIAYVVQARHLTD